MITLFLLLQIIFFCMMAFHDWIHIPPLTDINELKKHHSFKNRLFGSCVNGGLVAIPLTLTILFGPNPPSWVKITTVIVYGILTVGTICAWWIPYFFGSSQAHKDGFKEYAKTHRFLPPRGDNVIPNTVHIILHIVTWSCFAMSLYNLL